MKKNKIFSLLLLLAMICSVTLVQAQDNMKKFKKHNSFNK